MFLLKKKSKGNVYYYLATNKRIKNKCKTVILQKLGKEADLLEKDPDFLKKKQEEIDKMNDDFKKENVAITKVLDPTRKLRARTYNAGLFPVFKEMIDSGIYKALQDNITPGNEKYNCARITADLIAQRIIASSSKLDSYEKISANPFFDAEYSIDDVYRSLTQLQKSIDAIQHALAKKNKEGTSIVFYDTTNFYFEIEEADENNGLRQYGISKEHRPNPIVQMGLFMNGSGHPLWCNVNPGNTAECNTVIPSALQMSKAGISNYVYCADAGIGSGKIKVHNNNGARKYVVAQSLKKLDGISEKWALSDGDWKYTTENTTKTGLKKENCPKDGFLWKELLRKVVVSLKDSKGKPMKCEIAERLIVTYSESSFKWETHKLDNKIKRALNSLKTSKETNPNSASTITSSVVVDSNDEVVEDVSVITGLDQEKIDNEKKYHGLYAVVTNMPKSVTAEEVLAINAKRFQIENYFREMKSTVSTRPMYVRKDENIKGHIFICYLAVMLLMEMQAKLEEKKVECCTPSSLKETLQGMLLKEYEALGYEPCHTGMEKNRLIREAMEDMYHLEALETEFIPNSKMKKLKKILETKVCTTK